MNKESSILGLLVVYYLHHGLTYEMDMTVYIDAGSKECFYHHLKCGETIDIEYEVTDGGHGDLNINFSLSDSIGLIIARDFNKSENSHRHESRKDGDLHFCFNNTFNLFNSFELKGDLFQYIFGIYFADPFDRANRKTVYFQLIVEKEEGEQTLGDEGRTDLLETRLTPQEHYKEVLQNMMNYVEHMRMQMKKSRRLHHMIRSHKTRDRYLAESYVLKVNACFFVQICAMIIVGLLQVCMLRSLFETDSRMSKFFRKVSL